MTAGRRWLQGGSLACALLFVRCSTLAIEGFDLSKETALVGAGLLAVASLSWRVGDGVRFDAVDRTLGAAVGLAVLSAAFGVNPWIGLRATLFFVGCAATFVAARQVARAEGFRPLLQAAALGVVLVAASMLLEAWGLLHLSLPGRAPGGLLGHRNYAAHLCALGLPVLCWLSIAPERRSRTAALAALAVVVAALVLTRCRTAWVGAACGLSVLSFGTVWLALRGEQPASRGRLGAIALALTAGLLGATLLPHRLAWSSGRPLARTLATIADLESGSGRGRVLQARTTLSMIAAHPILGVGPGGWSVEYSRYAPAGDPTVQRGEPWQTPPRATSDWLGLCAERGLPGLLLLVAAGLLAVWPALGRVLGRRGAGPEDPRVGDSAPDLALLGLFATLLPMSAFDCPLQVAPVAQLAFLAAGALAPEPVGRLDRLRGARWFGPALGGVAIAAMLFLGAQVAAGLLVERGSREARELGARLAPGNPRLQLVVAASSLEWLRFDRCEIFAERALAISPTLQLARTLRDECRARRPASR